MMLASTVQFSRYGRSRPRIARRRHRLPVLAEVQLLASEDAAAVPSGPNSVLGPSVPRPCFPYAWRSETPCGRTHRAGSDARTE